MSVFAVNTNELIYGTVLHFFANTEALDNHKPGIETTQHNILVLASRASACLLDTKTLKNHPSGHAKNVVRNF